MSDETTLATLDPADLRTVLGGSTCCYPGKPRTLPSMAGAPPGGGADATHAASPTHAPNPAAALLGHAH